MLGFVFIWLVNSAVVAFVAGFRTSEMTPGQWFLVVVGGFIMNIVEAKLIHYFVGERKPIFHPVTGEMIGSFREPPGRKAGPRPSDGRVRSVGAGSSGWIRLDPCAGHADLATDDVASTQPWTGSMNVPAAMLAPMSG